MIKTRVYLKAVRETVVRPMAKTVMQDIMQAMRIDSNVYTLLASEADAFEKNEKFDNQLDNPRTTPRVEELYFTLSEETRTETLTTTPANRKNYKPIIADAEVGLSITPVYVEKVYTFSIRYDTRSKTNAKAVLNRMKVLMAGARLRRIHNVKYRFLIDDVVMDLVLDTLVCKNAVKPDEEKEGFEDYLIAHNDGRLNFFAGIDGSVNNSAFGVQETQLQVNGMFETNVENIDREYDGAKGMHRISLDYKLTFNEPLALDVVYEPVVFNQLLAEDYLKLNYDYKNAYKPGMPTTYMNENFEPFRMDYKDSENIMNAINSEYFVHIPAWDIFKPPMYKKYYVRIFSVLTTITLEDKRTLFNLGDLPDYAIDDDVLNFISNSEYQYINKDGYSVFNLSLTKNDVYLNDTRFELTPTLDVQATEDLDIKGTYRAFFSVCVDLSVLSPRALSALVGESAIYNKIINGLGIVQKTAVTDVRDAIISKSLPFNPRAYMHTVMTTQLLAERSN